MRKTAVTRSSTVSTQAGGEGIACTAEDVEMLPLVVFCAVNGLGSVGACGDSDTSSGLSRCLRGTIVMEVSRCGAGRQCVLVVDLGLAILYWIVGGENAVVASKAAKRR